MNKSQTLRKIQEATFNAVKQICGSPITDFEEQSTNPNFQLLIPMRDWNWEITQNIGVTPREQYEFCDHMPQSCKPGVQFSSSSKSFSDNYKAFVETLDPSFRPEQILKETNSKLTLEPTTKPADTSDVPDGWAKVIDGSGILRWRRDWSTENPNDWISRIQTNGGYSGTISFTTLVSGEDKTNSNEQLLRYRSDNGNWHSILIQPGEVQNIKIYAEAWDRITIQPGAWYNSAILGIGSDGPFISGYQPSTFFSDSGLLGCRISEFVVAYKPKLTMDTSNNFVDNYNKQLLSATELQVAGFIFKKSDSNLVGGLIKSEKMNGGNRYSTSLTSIVPKIIGVFIECFYSCKKLGLIKQ
ncbi:hypothetical protein FD723_22260 [Nostoc sp. C052]|uniref:hypothetical protein n=1 Tax=Nostoc sp. C052 TaxID=2576902 RepID=UPI0015C401A3|nr:hypothetical protein [Nostoc sp. C052]QLE42895.1 hypothetical protein FD723_22260 [Nostoc sp. C052]